MKESGGIQRVAVGVTDVVVVEVHAFQEVRTGLCETATIAIVVVKLAAVVVVVGSLQFPKIAMCCYLSWADAKACVIVVVGVFVGGVGVEVEVVAVGRDVEVCELVVGSLIVVVQIEFVEAARIGEDKVDVAVAVVVVVVVAEIVAAVGVVVAAVVVVVVVAFVVVVVVV
jgi:hypothetical protein